MKKNSISNGLSSFITVVITISTMGIIGSLIIYFMSQRIPGVEEEMGYTLRTIKINLVIFISQIISCLLILRNKKIGIYLFLTVISANFAKTIIKDPSFIVIPIIAIVIVYFLFYLLIKKQYRHMS